MTQPSDHSPTPAPQPTADDRTLEARYDTEVSPLMVEIIAACKRLGIPFYASFALDADLVCTSHFMPSVDEMPEDEGDYVRWRRTHIAAGRAMNATSTPPLAITVRDGSGAVTRSEVIL